MGEIIRMENQAIEYSNYAEFKESLDTVVERSRKDLYK